tara:strand:- start:42 stop:338 length:297 start_codon:yes stop_codon:yes gene_type:complete
LEKNVFPEIERALQEKESKTLEETKPETINKSFWKQLFSKVKSLFFLRKKIKHPCGLKRSKIKIRQKFFLRPLDSPPTKLILLLLEEVNMTIVNFRMR